MKRLLVAASRGLVLWGVVAAQAIDLGDDREFGRPNCLESPELGIFALRPPPK
jgi:hypothetical protein